MAGMMDFCAAETPHMPSNMFHFKMSFFSNIHLFLAVKIYYTHLICSFHAVFGSPGPWVACKLVVVDTRCKRHTFFWSNTLILVDTTLLHWQNYIPIQASHVHTTRDKPICKPS
jgi:hypothetical protein